MTGVKCRTCGKIFATHRAQMDHHRAKHQKLQSDEQKGALVKDALSEMWDEDYDVLYWHGLEDTGDK